MLNEKVLAQLMKCGSREQKRKMWTILARFGSYGHNRTIGQVCDTCMEKGEKT